MIAVYLRDRLCPVPGIPPEYKDFFCLHTDPRRGYTASKTFNYR